MTMTMTMKGVSTLSKKRFSEIESRVRAILAADEAAADDVMRAIREVMMFDPLASCYSEDVREKLVVNTRKWRQKKMADREQQQQPVAAGDARARLSN